MLQSRSRRRFEEPQSDQQDAEGDEGAAHKSADGLPVTEDDTKAEVLPEHSPGAQHDEGSEAEIGTERYKAATCDDAASEPQNDPHKRRDGQCAESGLPSHKRADHGHECDVTEADRGHSKDHIRGDSSQPHQTRACEKSRETPDEAMDVLMMLHPFGKIRSIVKDEFIGIDWAWNGLLIVAPVDPDMDHLKFAAHGRHCHCEDSPGDDDDVGDNIVEIVRDRCAGEQKNEGDVEWQSIDPQRV